MENSGGKGRGAFLRQTSAVVKVPWTCWRRLPGRMSRILIWLLPAMGRNEAILNAGPTELGLADRVRFLGFLNQSQLPSIYCAADLFVLPSLFETLWTGRQRGHAVWLARCGQRPRGREI